MTISIQSACDSSDMQEQFQRGTVFQTRCTIGGKVCSMIIDGGSCTNLASQTMVSKLGLTTSPHPSPYEVQWFSEGTGITVNTQILLSFSIGRNYIEELWCDVIPMDVCHVILGRPWLYDRRVVHDGYQNTYTLNHNNRRIVLTPLKAPKTEPLTAEQTKSEPPTIVTKLENFSLVSPTLLPPSPENFNQDFPPLLSPSTKKSSHSFSPPLPPLQKRFSQVLSQETEKEEEARESDSLCDDLKILEPKKNGEQILCMDNRAINKYYFSIPRLKFLLDDLLGPKVFFRMFMRLMTRTLKRISDKIVVVYFDDIFVYNRSEQEAGCHLTQDSQVLAHDKSDGNLEKCHFFTTLLVCLCFLVSSIGIMVDDKEVQEIRNERAPVSLTILVQSNINPVKGLSCANFDELQRTQTESMVKVIEEINKEVAEMIDTPNAKGEMVQFGNMSARDKYSSAKGKNVTKERLLFSNLCPSPKGDPSSCGATVSIKGQRQIANVHKFTPRQSLRANFFKEGESVVGATTQRPKWRDKNMEGKIVLNDLI